jgi:riboflavin synthase
MSCRATSTARASSARVLAIAIDPDLERYLVEKGSVAVQGVSLTVSALRDGGFEISLIPETLQRTSLGEVAVGDRLNLEVDVLAKHVERLLQTKRDLREKEASV